VLSKPKVREALTGCLRNKRFDNFKLRITPTVSCTTEVGISDYACRHCERKRCGNTLSRHRNVERACPKLLTFHSYLFRRHEERSDSRADMFPVRQRRALPIWDEPFQVELAVSERLKPISGKLHYASIIGGPLRVRYSK